MRILSLDPGGTTGWALLDFDLDTLEGSLKSDTYLRDHVKSGQLGNNTEHHLVLWTLIMRTQPDVIVGERFDNRGNEYSKIMSREYIGVVKLVGQLDSGIVVRWQGSDQKEWATDEKLRILQILCVPKHPWRHANDALRHLVHFLVFSAGHDLSPIRNFILDQLKALTLEDE